MSGCSKYCLGIYYTNKRFGHDTFKKAIKTIEKLRPEEIVVEKKTVKKLATLTKNVVTPITKTTKTPPIV
jgi:hypothetical protein